TLGRVPKILMLGDGIGIDSIRMSNSGFYTDYMDSDESNMVKIAQLNFVSVKRVNVHAKLGVVNDVNKEKEYDAVVCLEVIEHVPNPIEFIRSVANHLGDGG